MNEESAFARLADRIDAECHVLNESGIEFDKQKAIELIKDFVSAYGAGRA